MIGHENTQVDRGTHRRRGGSSGSIAVGGRADVLRMNLVGTVDGPELSAIYAEMLEWGKTSRTGSRSSMSRAS